MLSSRARCLHPATFSSADAELIQTLDSLGGASNYANWILDLIVPHLGPEVLELGPGHATFTEHFARRAKRLVAVDLSERCVTMLRERFGGEPGIDILHGGVDTAVGRGPYDCAILINVLEHIEDDTTAISQLSSSLKPGGRLVLWVPAFNALYSRFDRKIGHYRRYRAPSLRSQLEDCGLDPIDVRYVNAAGAIGWLVLARLLGRTPTVGAPVAIFDRYLVPLIRRVEGRLPVPFGQSVFAVAARI